MTYREVKGSPLTFKEMDDNLKELKALTRPAIVSSLPTPTVDTIGILVYLINNGLFINISTATNPTDTDCSWVQI